MKRIIALALAAGVTLSAVPANAADGCGRGFHRGPYGRCHPNGGPGFGPGYGRGPAVIAPGGALIIGNFYQGRGYWDGHRYYQNRYRYGNGYRYR